MSVISSPLPGDSIWLKALATVPFVGIVAQLRCETIIETVSSRTISSYSDCRKDSPESLPSHIIKLIQVVELKNHYKVCGIIRSILEIAAIVATRALCVFSGWLFVPVTLSFLAGSYSIFTLLCNKHLIATAKVPGGLDEKLDIQSVVTSY